MEIWFTIIRRTPEGCLTAQRSIAYPSSVPSCPWSAAPCFNCQRCAPHAPKATPSRLDFLLVSLSTSHISHCLPDVTPNHLNVGFSSHAPRAPCLSAVRYGDRTWPRRKLNRTDPTLNMGLFSRKSTKNETPETPSSVAPGHNVAYRSPRNMVPKITLPPAPDPAENPAAYLRSIYAVSLARRRALHGAAPMDVTRDVLTMKQVRQRANIVLEKAKKNQLKHFDVDLEKVCFHDVFPSLSQADTISV